MGIMSKGREARADKAADAATVAWVDGDLAYVHLVRVIGNQEAGIGKQVSEILGVGWTLAGTAMLHDGHLHSMMFTFVRP